MVKVIVVVWFILLPAKTKCVTLEFLVSHRALFCIVTCTLTVGGQCVQY